VFPLDVEYVWVDEDAVRCATSDDLQARRGVARSTLTREASQAPYVFLTGQCYRQTALATPHSGASTWAARSSVVREREESGDARAHAPRPGCIVGFAVGGVRPEIMGVAYVDIPCAGAARLTVCTHLDLVRSSYAEGFPRAQDGESAYRRGCARWVGRRPGVDDT
jgi:hypothetical protein